MCVRERDNSSLMKFLVVSIIGGISNKTLLESVPSKVIKTPLSAYIFGKINPFCEILRGQMTHHTN